MMGWKWQQLDHMQIICTSLQRDNHANTLSLIFTRQVLFVMPNQQCQSTDALLHSSLNKMLTMHKMSVNIHNSK